ncbi:MAG: hypothetical protein ACRD96_01190, partial [Bryobacteraceae bacterium]
DQIRDALKGVGYTPGDAQVEARGTIVDEAGKRRFKLAGVDRVYDLEGPAPPPGEVTLSGAIPAPRDRAAPEVLRVSMPSRD